MVSKLFSGNLLLVLLTCACLQSASQALTLSQTQLMFSDTDELGADSIQLTLTNTLARDVTVTSIRFYSILGDHAFSCANVPVAVPALSSADIWIRFQPSHNIFYNSEMVIEDDGLRGFCTADLRGQGTYSNTYYSSTQNLVEEALKNELKSITGNGFVSAGYSLARDFMFMDIDNKLTNGQGASQNTIECIYTGREAIGYTDRADAQNNYSFNTEHVFPQGYFSSSEPMRSDLHHLFPTDDDANNTRADDPFGTVSNPTWTDGGSKSNGSRFEPRDSFKGAIARAMFYFVTRYQDYTSFFSTQEQVLRTWHASFPPSQVEMVRNDDIEQVQHNRNPFIDYPVFVQRISSLASFSITPAITSIDITQDTIIGGTIPASVNAFFRHAIVNTGNQAVQLTNFQLNTSGDLEFDPVPQDTILLPGESYSLHMKYFSSDADSVTGYLTYNTSAPGSGSVSIPVYINSAIFTGVNHLNSFFNSVYPNPATISLSISDPSLIGGGVFRVLNVTGALVYQEILSPGSSTHTIETFNFPPGIYQVIFEDVSGWKQSARFIRH